MPVQSNTSAKRSGLSDNAISAISYIAIVPAIVFLVLPPYSKRPMVRLHAWQSIFFNLAAFSFACVFELAVAFTALVSSSFSPSLSWIITLAWTVKLGWIMSWVLCAVKALNGRGLRIPLIGALAERQSGFRFGTLAPYGSHANGDSESLMEPNRKDPASHVTA